MRNLEQYPLEFQETIETLSSLIDSLSKNAGIGDIESCVLLNVKRYLEMHQDDFIEYLKVFR
ncbi:MAG: hypothetical protein WD512_14365 [Candidatus Paceibacterota bacterium]